jgi:hypothetical protein
MIMVDKLFKAVSLNSRARFIGTRTNHQWCHMWCEPGNEEELHKFALAIGMKIEWFQDKKNFPHYDLIPSKRKKAIELGAIEIDLKQYLKQRKLK